MTPVRTGADLLLVHPVFDDPAMGDAVKTKEGNVLLSCMTLATVEFMRTGDIGRSAWRALPAVIGLADCKAVFKPVPQHHLAVPHFGSKGE